MIPKQMESYLRAQLPEQTWENRLIREEGHCFIEFGSLDVDRLTRLGIQVDTLGPRLVACMWDETSSHEIGGYLVVDNLAMGRPSMGGIRMVSYITPSEVHNLARGMTLKNAAANLPYGGGKGGIVTGGDLSPKEHIEVVRGFARLLFRYRDIFLPGPDVGTNDSDMKTIAIENGLDNALSKPAEMGGNRIDQLGAAGGGLIIALESLLYEMPRLKVLPQFSNLQVPSMDDLMVMIQGFGAVGANAARFLSQRLPGARVVGVSDAYGYLYNQNGLPIDKLFALWQSQGLITQSFYEENLVASPASNKTGVKFSNSPDDMLRESAFCMIPATPLANYLDTDPSTHPSMTTDRMGEWSVIVEGANTYSPDLAIKAARARMERTVYRHKGILIATDYMVNSGGVIYAAQEQIIKTPPHLRIPDEMLGNREAVDHWLEEHCVDLEMLAEKRRLAAETARDEVIRRNMRELIDLLITDADMLPCEGAEQISIRRIASSESDRTAADIMESIITIPINSSIRQAAQLLVEAGSPIMAVVTPQGELAGVVTDWDITRATALGLAGDISLNKIMTRRVISASLNDSILEMVRKLEYHEISAMPVVDQGKVLGMVGTDLLSRRSLLRLLQSQAK